MHLTTGIHSTSASGPWGTALQGNERRIRVALVVSSLDFGGAERQVIEIGNRLDPHKFEVTLISLAGMNTLSDCVDQSRVRFVSLAKRWRFDVSVVLRLARLLRELQIEVAHGFLFDADIATRVAGRLARVPVVLGSERNSGYREPRLRASFNRLTRGCIDGLVANSHAGADFAVQNHGIDPKRVRVVHNGVDVERFCPRSQREARRHLQLPEKGRLVGMVASFKPQKNHEMFLRMAQQVRRQMSDVWFVLAGDRLSAEGSHKLSLRPGAGLHGNARAYHRHILSAIRTSGVEDRLIMLGNRRDVESVYASCDLTVLTSRHEGTPNVVLESLACGIPVVATNVADNARLIPDESVGYVVADDDDAMMARHVIALLHDHPKRAAMGRTARGWIADRFSIAAMCEAVADVYQYALQAGAANALRSSEGHGRPRD